MKRSFFTIKFTYFKPSGKFYSSGEYRGSFQDCGPEGHPYCYMNQVVDLLHRWFEDGTPLPGLLGTWKGPILITCEEGHPVLIQPAFVKQAYDDDYERSREPLDYI